LNRRHALAAALIAAALTASPLLAGCSSPPSCSTGSCATREIQKSLVGLQAKDGAAITQASCETAVADPGGNWTATCEVDESDGSVSQGKGTWFVNTKQVAYEPLTVINGGG
jgi:hypothetical protein